MAVSIPQRKLVAIFLGLLLLSLQYRLWVGEGSAAHIVQLNRDIHQQRQVNEQLQKRNDRLYATVTAFKHSLDAVEEKARSELGMIRKGETFFLVVPEK